MPTINYAVPKPWPVDATTIQRSEIPDFGAEKWLAPPTVGRIITKAVGKPKLNHEYQFKWEIPD